MRAEPAFWSVLIGTFKVKALQAAREYALTCTAATRTRIPDTGH